MPLDDADKKARPASNNTGRQSQLPTALESGKGQDYAKTNLIQIPSINLPKGGAALKSIDEKFQVNGANGTSTFSVTIPMSKSRSNFAPSLSLNYNSGGGNSAFGLGWSLSLPSIRRRTDKKLPRYRDADNSDIFQLTGAEDLVLQLLDNGAAGWQPDAFPTGNYAIQRFRPRIEGAFTLIEQVVSPAGMYWKTTARDNSVTFYGLTAEGRVADPANPSHVYEWLPQLSYDDKGNCFQFFYVAENPDNVPSILHEGNRLNGNQAVANTYLKQVAWGNRQPYSPAAPGSTPDPYSPLLPDETGYFFGLVLDYGDHNLTTPAPIPSGTWGSRLDPFSNYKPGFETRTYRLCRRFLLFHNFTDLDTTTPGGMTPNPVLVKSLDLAYKYYDFQPVADPYTLNFVEADYIVSVTETGWVGTEEGGYQSYSYPACTFTYQRPVWNKTVETISAEDRMNIPAGLSSPYQFTDLYNEGIAGILSEQSEGWYYNSNLGEGVFTPSNLIAPKPSFTGLTGGGLQLTSLTGDGRKFIVSTRPPDLGYFELTDAQEWQPFLAFDRYPAVDLNDPNIKFIDLNGDGMPDIVLSEEQVFTWYPAAGVCGYDSPEMAPKSFDEEKGPAIVFADPVGCIFQADMSGDGLTDIVRIRNGEISYWPNLGYGLFGAKVNMTNAPLFDTIDAFNPEYLRLADIDGTGATDILYLGQDKLRAWLNLSGNAWGDPFETGAFPDTASPNQLSVLDFLGNGTACIVWSSPLANNADSPMRYIDLMGGGKPYLMSGYSNGMGKQVSINYKSSTYFYLQDKLAGTPWITKLCFPVQCVASIATRDSVSGTRYCGSYTYHHGYYDHAEKEYRGFGRVDQIDTDTFDIDATADQAQVLTKTWFHTGAYFGMNNILHQLAAEYFKNPSSFTEYNLPEPILPANLTADEAREAVRACKGMILRQEIYALDGNINPALTGNPYTVAEHNNDITLLQPQGPNLYAVFLSVESEMITYNYDRIPADPRIAHTLNTAFDVYGNIVDTYAVVYARQPVNPATPDGRQLPGGQLLPAAVTAVQQITSILYTHNAYTADRISPTTYRLGVGCEAITWQLTGIDPAATYYSIGDFTNSAARPTLTKLKHHRTLFRQDDLVTPMLLGTMDTLGLVYQQYSLAFNASVTALAGYATTALLQGAQYAESDAMMTAKLFPSTDATGEWWVPGGRISYLNGVTAQPFLLPYQYLDAYGYATTLVYDQYWLLLSSVTDAAGNTTTAAPLDYRVMQPQTVTDPNGNATDYKYDGLGLLVAIAQRGKGEGDVFDPTFTADLTPALIAGFFSDPFTNGPPLLKGATIRYIYDFVPGGPFSTGAIGRTVHANQAPETWAGTPAVQYQFSFEYIDSLGRIAMKKIQADVNTGTPAAGTCDGPILPAHQWIGNGKTVYNNKGNPVMQYQPYFSPTSAYEEAPANGVTPVIHYDPLGRVIRTDFPDGSFSHTTFGGWVQIICDQNDTVKDSQWYQDYFNSPNALEVDAANKAAVHYETPTTAHLDPLSRNFYSVAFSKDLSGNAVLYATQVLLDLESNPLSLIDAMGNTVVQWDYDLLNRPVHQLSMDAGDRWMLHDVMDRPYMQWDVNGTNNIVFSYTYDMLHRLLQSQAQINGAPYLASYNIYGENIKINGAADTANNLRGNLYRQFDDAGLITHYCYDFKNNLVQSSRIFATAFQAAGPLLPVIAWAGDAGDMELLSTSNVLNEEYTNLFSYDALNRPLQYTRPFIPVTPGAVISPPYSQSSIKNADVFVPGYGESGGLNTVSLYYGGGGTATAYVKRICHNEKGQRLCIQYGNNTVTRYTYDPATLRLTRLLTTVNMGTSIIQDINYYYDPVGNITYQLDNAQPPLHYGNQEVLSDGNYTYDPVYRLISAMGREQISQNTVDESSANNNYRNYPFQPAAIPQPGNMLQMRAYTQTYTYDPVGNMKQLQHSAGIGSYTRVFAYNNNVADRTAFGVSPAAVFNNQLLATTVGSGSAVKYGYDGHGNMLNLPPLPQMNWNYRDQFATATQQAVNTGTGQSVYYNYDASGMRVRKTTVGASSPGGTVTVLTERLYIGNFEIYREFDSSGISLQRETLHVMDDKTRIATIDNKTIDTDGADTTAKNTYYPRYQYGNHLGSTAYELDDGGDTISYEEYHPFGTTSFQAMAPNLDVPAKRYRYTGKERDEESGLYYHGARYYAPWLCRWTAADPVGMGGGINVYGYCMGNPIINADVTGTQAQPVQIDNATPEFNRALSMAQARYGADATYNVTYTTHEGESPTGSIVVDSAGGERTSIAYANGTFGIQTYTPASEFDGINIPATTTYQIWDGRSAVGTPANAQAVQAALQPPPAPAAPPAAVPPPAAAPPPPAPPPAAPAAAPAAPPAGAPAAHAAGHRRDPAERMRDQFNNMMADPQTGAALQRAAQITGVPIASLSAMALIESGGNRNVGTNANGYNGLMQLGRAAIRDILQTIPDAAQNGISWENIQNDVNANALAGAYYWQMNEQRLAARNVPVTPTTVYLAHQQGAAGAAALIRTIAANPDAPLTPNQANQRVPNVATQQQFFDAFDRRMQNALNAANGR
jgi:RHS repeat-associated protein